VDVSGWPALAAAIRDRASAFGVSASELAALAGQPGFYLLEAGSFGHGPDSRGYLVVFVPQRWLTVSQQEDPRRIAISLDGQHLEGRLDSPPVASASFSTLSRRWRIDVATEPATGLQMLLPWLSLAWPIAAALIVLLVGRTIVRRRQAERDVERFFDLSLDMLCTASFDGYFKRVNPAFERTLGYSSRELLSRPFFDFVHRDDVEATREALRALARGEEVHQLENRYICSDGSERWLEWSTRPGAGEGLVYGVARDVTDRRRAEDEQTALRRVATLVAARGSQGEVFDAVAAEVGHILQADMTRLLRYEPDGTATVVAARNRPGLGIKVGTRVTLEGESVAATVRRSGRAARIDGYEGAPGSIAATLRGLGMRTAAGAPIIVEGRLWGVIVAAWQQHQPKSADTESRMAQFTELVATAIANAEGRAELAASRARVVTAGDETRRRIERDLHDGTQQRLVSLALELRAAEATVPSELVELRAQLSHAAEGLSGAVDDLREISRGIHPAILSKGGLGAVLRTLARRSPVPVELDLPSDRRLPEGVEVALYYVASEALTNVTKHARASAVHLRLEIEDRAVRLSIRDDGVGGARPEQGSGLIGLRDRVEVLGGTIGITSPQGGGTTLIVEIPLADP
jgi:PAS domain S-box-containing protein